MDAVAIFLASFPCCLCSYCLTVFIFPWYKYFLDSSFGKESTCNARDLGSIPGLGRSPGDRKGYPFQYSVLGNSRECIVHGIKEGNGTPLQYSCLENPMDGGAWWVAVHGVTKSQTQLSDFTFIFHFDALEKEMATHSCVLAWSIPGTGEPGGLPSMGSHRVGHDWSDLAAAAAERLSL